MSWPWAWRFWRPALLELGVGEAVGVAEGVGDGLVGFAAGLELGDGEAAGEAAVSARAPAGAIQMMSPPARLRTATVTLRRARRWITTEGGEFTAL